MRAAPVIKAGYVMVGLNLALSIYFWLQENNEDNRFHRLLFMCGAAAWIIVILVWYKVAETEE